MELSTTVVKLKITTGLLKARLVGVTYTPRDHTVSFQTANLPRKPCGSRPKGDNADDVNIECENVPINDGWGENRTSPTLKC